MNQNPSSDPLKIDDWDGAMGAKWLSQIDMFEAMLAPAGQASMEMAGFAPGESVVDIGCGGGGTTIDIATVIGNTGHATGVDISRELVAAAISRARRANLTNLSFIHADAATSQLEQAPFDRLYSRFGSMFFADPAAAFANLRRMIRPGGRADLATWAPVRDNGWISEMLAVAARHIAIPTPVPGTPGPFALDRPDYIRALLEGAGFTHVVIERWAGMQPVGAIGTQPAAAAEFMLSAGPIATLTEGRNDGLREAVKRDLISLFYNHSGPTGVTMSASAWLISAHA